NAYAIRAYEEKTKHVRPWVFQVIN
ncbi:3-isopropylmalate dehydratase small subunit, partial [Acinetobacter baumannii]